MRRPRRRRARERGAAAGAAASPLLSTVLTGPSAEAVPPGQPSYDVERLRRRPLPARRERGGHGHRHACAATEPRRAAAPAAPASPRLDGIDGAHAVRARVAAASPTPTSRRRAPALSERAQDAVRAIRDRRGPGGGRAARLRQHGPLHRPEGEPGRPPAAGRRRSSRCTTLLLLFLLTGSVILPIKTLVMNALTLGGDARDHRARLPGGPARRPLRLHGPGGGRGDEPRLPVRRRCSAWRPTTRCSCMARIKEQHDHGAERGGGRDRDRPHGAGDHARRR